MKKALLSMVGILMGVYLLLSYLGSGSEYVAEKSFWEINQDFERAAKSPNTTPINTFEALIQRYEGFISQFPKSNLIPMAEISIARVYLAEKEYSAARDKLEDIIQKNRSNVSISVQAIADIGQSYAMEEDWQSVLRIYQRIMTEYSQTELGLKAPLLIAQLYVNKNKIDKAQEAFQNAVEYYESVSQKYPNSAIGYESLRLLASCYIGQNKFQQGVETMERVLLEYPQIQYLTPQKAEEIINMINAISLQKLGDYNLVIGIYSNFIKKFPQHALSPRLQDLIGALKEQRRKDELSEQVLKKNSANKYNGQNQKTEDSK